MLDALGATRKDLRYTGSFSGRRGVRSFKAYPEIVVLEPVALLWLVFLYLRAPLRDIGD